MTTAAIVQARMGSTRLPGEVLELRNDHMVLEEVLRRSRAIPGTDVVAGDPRQRQLRETGMAGGA